MDYVKCERCGSGFWKSPLGPARCDGCRPWHDRPTRWEVEDARYDRLHRIMARQSLILQEQAAEIRRLKELLEVEW